jgi:hypothetical protein
LGGAGLLVLKPWGLLGCQPAYCSARGAPHKSSPRQGKYVKQIKKGANQSTTTLEIIHTDICGPFFVKSVDGYDSFITFTDDYSRYGYIYPIKEKSKALDKFKIFKAEAENQHDRRIKIVRSDHGGEYYGRYTPYGQVPGPFARFL